MSKRNSLTIEQQLRNEIAAVLTLIGDEDDLRYLYSAALGCVPEKTKVKTLW